ncbi:MAG TPA: hypothetical protein VN948_14310 [Terriglobales bacterium]|nr:hypothetical protein [Terriglobales bacterium]
MISTIRIYLDESGLLAADRVLAKRWAHDSPSLLAPLGECKAAFAQEVVDLSVTLKGLAVLYSRFDVHGNLLASDATPALASSAGFNPGLTSFFVSGYSAWNQLAATEISVANPRCARRWGELQPTGTCPPLFGSVVSPFSICPKCSSINCGPNRPLNSVAEIVLDVICALEDHLYHVRRALSTVRAACVVLISLLLRVLVPRGIAVRQRCFFTHHGTHPPDAVPNHSGLFPERAFLHPSVA